MGKTVMGVALASLTAWAACGSNRATSGGTIHRSSPDGLTLSMATGGASNRYFHDVWGSAADDVWVVGFEGTIVHWNGRAWRTVASGTSQDLYAVWGSGRDDAWIVGAGGTVLRWDGTVWSSLPTATATPLNGVWGSGATDVWLVGAAGTLLHWDGTALSPASSTVLQSYAAVSGAAADDVWVAGSIDGDDAVGHWNGVSWIVSLLGDDQGVSDLFVTAPDDMWIVGGDRIFYSDGGGFQRRFSSSETTGVWASSRDDVWIVGDHGAQHFDGATVHAVAAKDWGTFADVWGAGPGDVWVVGGIEN